MKILFKRKEEHGFTLAEVLVYMAIFSILLIVLSSAFTTTLDSRIESVSTSDLEQDSRFLLYRFTHDIQSAQSIVIPSTNGSSGSTLQIVINSTTNTYTLSNSDLVLTNTNGTNQLNSFDTTISNLSFLRLGNTGGKSTVTVSFTITSKTIRNGVHESKQFSTTVGLQ